MEETETAEQLVSIRDEIQQQYNALKESFEQVKTDMSQTIENLKTENETLKRALVQSTFTAPAPKEQVKSEEEIYAEKIDGLVKKAIEYRG